MLLRNVFTINNVTFGAFPGTTDIVVVVFAVLLEIKYISEGWIQMMMQNGMEWKLD